MEEQHFETFAKLISNIATWKFNGVCVCRVGLFCTGPATEDTKSWCRCYCSTRPTSTVRWAEGFPLSDSFSFETKTVHLCLDFSLVITGENPALAHGECMFCLVFWPKTRSNFSWWLLW